jgi:hypothetical protein
MEWQPIETAPHDVAVYLIYDPETKSVGQGHRTDLRSSEPDAWVFQATGWRAKPSHWMRLPDPPRDC